MQSLFSRRFTVLDDEPPFIIRFGRKVYLSSNADSSQASTDKFSPGDHLVVSRGLYSHHGIYAGNDQVIHYSGLSDGLQSGPVVRDTLSIFAKGEVVVRDYDSPKFVGLEVVRRAESRLGEDLYDVHSNNCEDFCSWAVTGSHGSSQINVAEAIISRVMPVAGAALQARKMISRTDGSDSDTSSQIKSAVGTAALVVAMPALAPYIAVRSVLRFFSK